MCLGFYTSLTRNRNPSQDKCWDSEFLLFSGCGSVQQVLSRIFSRCSGSLCKSNLKAAAVKFHMCFSSSFPAVELECYWYQSSWFKTLLLRSKWVTIVGFLMFCRKIQLDDFSEESRHTLF
ncbi:hypothetical protein XENORESO_004090 [Xenotaenia resolanae]|uniref:Uncharacterized protein n=1 Tax=Xenotaenia resolanae TaxID=208358 RepID=A0ABV0W958_9TELE